MQLTQYLFILFLIFGGAHPKPSTTSFTAKVIGIKDGDTIEVLYQGKSETIRLLDIDCPEKKQAFGQKAKQFTSDLCFGKEVRIERNEKPDRYQRSLATVFVGKTNVNEALVKAGLAWYFKKYSDNKTLATLESIAIKKKVGLWADHNPIAPWDYRKKRAANFIRRY